VDEGTNVKKMLNSCLQAIAKEIQANNDDDDDDDDDDSGLSHTCHNHNTQKEETLVASGIALVSLLLTTCTRNVTAISL